MNRIALTCIDFFSVFCFRNVFHTLSVIPVMAAMRRYGASCLKQHAAVRICTVSISCISFLEAVLCITAFYHRIAMTAVGNHYFKMILFIFNCKTRFAFRFRRNRNQSCFSYKLCLISRTVFRIKHNHAPIKLISNQIFFAGCNFRCRLIARNNVVSGTALFLFQKRQFIASISVICLIIRICIKIHLRKIKNNIPLSIRFTNAKSPVNRRYFQVFRRA